MYNPFQYVENTYNNLTPEQKYYPFKTKEEQDAALYDSVSVLGDVIPVAGSGYIKAIEALAKNAAKVVGMKGAIDGVERIKTSILSYLSKAFGVVISSIDKEELLKAGGEAAAKEFNRQLLKKYGIESPIVQFYSETVAEEFGEWFSELVNHQLSILMGEDVEPFSTLFPIDDIAPELDTFITTNLNERLNVNITSVLDIRTAVSELKAQLVDVVTQQVQSSIEQAKSQVMAANTVTGTSANALLRASIIGDALTFFESNVEVKLNNLLAMQPLNIKLLYGNRTRNLNKQRQRKYRQTHKQVSHWEPIE